MESMSSLTFSLQALLMRHEAYIADSERERKAMTAHIETLEAEKQALEKENATVIEENRSLLDQLEAVNNAVAGSDAHVTSLQATLQSTQQELHKLTQLAARTASLEQQLEEYEREQANWQSTYQAKEESVKSAVRRWQQAERTLAGVQEEIERIEQEAKEEKERHAEIVGRMERRHAVEKELGSAAGRLKGAAALKTTEKESPGQTVVSHFVKDILQDNANLQMGIVELREMLNNSNDEVENLRQQVQLHQPVIASEDTTPLHAKPKDLRNELNRANSQELHVHHHYHAPSAAPRPQLPRKKTKKRYGTLMPGQITPTSGANTPRSSFSFNSPTPTASILQQTAASIPQSIPTRSRWSMQSNQTYHSTALSGTSSPHSTTDRTSSLFDRVFSDAGNESSRPTSPDTEDPGSPVFTSMSAKRVTPGSFRTYSAPIVQRRGISPATGRPSLDSIMSIEELPNLERQSSGPEAIAEEREDDWENESSPPVEQESSVTSPMSEEPQSPIQEETFYRPPLRRAASHESLFSVSGMDIHTLKSRPSQLLAPYGGGRGVVRSQAVISDATAHATRPAAMSRDSGRSKNLLTGMAADQRQASNPTFGKKLGGWMFGRWGATPTPSSAETAVAATAKANKPASISSGSDKAAVDPQATPKKPRLRPPGINQAGPVMGFFPEVKMQHPPVMKSLDAEALKSVLDGQ